MNGSEMADLAKVIQLALAPVFLLLGIAALLGVMTGRIARIVDRGRALEDREAAAGGSPARESTELERHNLEHRRQLTSVAITATTVGALLVCVVIAGLFIEVLLGMPFKWLISALFAGAMLALMVGLTYFLQEVRVAMRTVRIAVRQESRPNTDASVTTWRPRAHNVRT